MNYQDLYSIEGLQFVPVNEQKRPLLKDWQTSLEKHDLTKCYGVGLVCGSPSGGVECVDVDCKYDITGKLFDNYKTRIHAADQTLLKLLVVQKTKSGGYHLIYRCSVNSGNTKLANRYTTEQEKSATYEAAYLVEVNKGTEDSIAKKVAQKARDSDKVRVLLETRSQGGQFVIHPTPGYEFIYGDLCSISEITPEQREVLYTVAMSFNEVVEEIKVPTRTNIHKTIGLSVFDDYNQRGDVLGLLQNNGWKIVSQKGNKTHLLRPGQTTAATSGNFDHEKNWFSVFTTSTEFEPQHAYLPYAVYAVLECGKDFSLASKKLFELGYGERAEVKKEAPKTSTRVIPSRVNVELKDKSLFATPADYDGYLQQVIDGTLQMGLTTGAPSFDEYFLFKEGELVMTNGLDNTGKALSLDTPIPSPYGWITMGDIKVGDRIFNESGEVVTVTFATDIMTDKKCYDIEFCNGQKIKSCGDHRWEVKRFGSNKQVLTTEEMYISGVLAHHKQKTISRFSIDLPKPIPGKKVDINIHPYIIGYWLGNGSHDKNIVYCHSNDADDVLNNIINLGWDKSYKKVKGNSTAIHILSSDKYFLSEIKNINLFKNKHIPNYFLRASIHQRVSLLNGLMDSDGYCSKSGAVEFCTIKKEISEPFMELLSSLGLRFSVSMKTPSISGRKMGYKAYYIGIACDKESCPIFSLKRKQNNIKEKSQRSKTIRIVSILQCESVPVRCIQVSGSSHLFLCGKTMIPTHNTEFMWYLDLLSAMYHGWRGVIFSSENTLGTFMRRMIQFYWGKPLRGSFAMSHDEYIIAKKFIEDHFLLIKAQEDLYNYKDIINLIKIARSEGDYKYGMIDPYNSLKVDLSGYSKLNTHEYHYEAISEIKSYGQQTKFGWVINHHAVTSAIRMRDADKKYPVAPRKEDTEGGGKMANKSDQFLTIHRITQHPTEWMITEVHVRKIKDTETGGKPTPIDQPVKFERYRGGYAYCEWLEGGQRGVDPVAAWHNQMGTGVQKIPPPTQLWTPYKDDGIPQPMNDIDF